MKTEAVPKLILLKDYRQPDFWIKTVDLKFDLHEDLARVHAKLTIIRNAAQTASKSAPLVLNGEQLHLEKVLINGRELSEAEYTVTDKLLTIETQLESFTLETISTNEPAKNLACEGLYFSGPTGNRIFCTQCEAESFRRITYFLDRPDVMAIYTVTIEADLEKYPVILSNGNPISHKNLGNGRHQAVWHDPHKKPCYLFALVAGDVAMIEDHYVTLSGRKVKLQIFARRGLEDRCWHAMKSIQRSMKWDEDTYGLEYDLDIFMIVVAEDFNMGAMENKGLNVFNANYVLANPQTATDADYDSILGIVGHEYFHNWTGNRVTCRDWFQLSLKEGLTVFRDQRFTSDMGSVAVKRIEDVIRLRTNQFAEDAGPMAHPIRPNSYLSIDNFYTLTVYEKGAEVIRMFETILGRDGFRKGMDLYFKRHDGQAVTTEDFVSSMSDANNVNFDVFKNWYHQAGTPDLKVDTTYDSAHATYTISLTQSSGPSPGQPAKLPYHIPVAVGLIGKDGKDLALHLKDPLENAMAGLNGSSSTTSRTENGVSSTMVLHLCKEQQSFTFTGVKEKPMLSLLRGFSAPVKAHYSYTDEDLAFLMAHDSDAFAKWEAAQTLAIRSVKSLVEDLLNHRLMKSIGSIASFIQAFAAVLNGAEKDPEFVSFMLELPAEAYLAQFFSVVDPEAIFKAREHLIAEIAKTHRPRLLEIYQDLATTGTEGDGAKAAARRALRSQALTFLAADDNDEALELALAQRRQAQNMTDEMGALRALNNSQKLAREIAMREFYEKWKNEPLVINKWLVIQSVGPQVDALARIQRLAKDPVFDKNNPNKIYSLYLAFAKYNLVRFHDRSGDAYRLIADQVLEIDQRNPQVASRLVGTFNQWKTLGVDLQVLIRRELERLVATPGLSTNVFEIASKTLKA